MQGVLWVYGLHLDQGQCGLDIGCASKKRDGFIGVDILKGQDVDVICDLEEGKLPFSSESFDVVYANHILEHIQDLEGLLSEISRVMKPGSSFFVGVPYAGDLRAFQDPTHKRFFTLKTFEYFVSEGSRVGQLYTPKYFSHIEKRSLVFGKGPLSLLMALIVNRRLFLLDLYESTVLRIIPAKDLQVELVK